MCILLDIELLDQSERVLAAPHFDLTLAKSTPSLYFILRGNHRLRHFESRLQNVRLIYGYELRAACYNYTSGGQLARSQIETVIRSTGYSYAIILHGCSQWLHWPIKGRLCWLLMNSQFRTMYKRQVAIIVILYEALVWTLHAQIII